MFIENLQTNPVFYISAVVGLIISITLHELAHGWAAIWKGDDTPRYLGHMTPDPITHMGPIGFAAVFLLGIGWGAMPVTPNRLRGKYAEAFVAAAGPVMNLLLALVALSALALWSNAMDESRLNSFQVNLRVAMWCFGYLNIALFIFNLAPIPPLDGSRILANFHQPYDQWLRDNEQLAGFLFFGFVSIVISISNTRYGLTTIAANAARRYMDLFM